MAQKTAKTPNKQKATEATNLVQSNKSVTTESKPRHRVEKIGTVAIDSGHVIIIDPCRVDEVHEHFDGPLNLTAQLGQFVVGSETGLGDGRYPVFAEIVNDEHFGERVMALHIHLDPMYCFADDPKQAELIRQDEAEYLALMNRE